MTYELAKKLKDAGFPKKEIICGNGIGNWVCKECQNWDKNPWQLFAPSLSELIEACGDHFLSLEKDDDKWEATQKTWCCDEHGESREYGYGDIPEEAVANLWLALNKKPDVL